MGETISTGTGLPSTNFGPVQPFGVRNTIMGQRGLSTVSGAERATLWISNPRDDRVERGGQL